jgi:hypothetical protein
MQSQILQEDPFKKHPAFTMMRALLENSDLVTKITKPLDRRGVYGLLHSHNQAFDKTKDA